jgi:hypothetical protein
MRMKVRLSKAFPFEAFRFKVCRFKVCRFKVCLFMDRLLRPVARLVEFNRLFRGSNSERIIVIADRAGRPQTIPQICHASSPEAEIAPQ